MVTTGTAAWLLALCLLSLHKPATQDLVKLRQFPKVLLAECGRKVTLNCKVNSSKAELSVKHMGWSQDGKSLCVWDREHESSAHEPSIHHGHSKRPFHCQYAHGHLSLSFINVQPQAGGIAAYLCKLRSKQGADQAHATVEFKECKSSQASTVGMRRAALDQTPKIKQSRGGVGSVRPMRALWCVSLLLAVIVK